MKRLKLLIGGKLSDTDLRYLHGQDAQLVDLDTGEKVECAIDITLKMPLDGAMQVVATMLVEEIEVVAAGPSCGQVRSLKDITQVPDDKTTESE